MTGPNPATVTADLAVPPDPAGGHGVDRGEGGYVVWGVERLWCEQHREGATVVVTLHGDLDLGTEPVLRAALLSAQGSDGTAAGTVVVDLEDVGFCAARGLSVLDETARRCAAGGVRFHVRRCPAQVLRLIDLIDLRRILGVQDAVRRPATR
jgi:anti-anti-sigma factor